MGTTKTLAKGCGIFALAFASILTIGPIVGPSQESAASEKQPTAVVAEAEADEPQEFIPPPLWNEPKNPFFALAKITAQSVRACRAAALAFDSNRRLEMAEKVVSACEADADKGAGRDCTMYAVRVASAASKFIHQMKMIEANNPAWQGMTDIIRGHNDEARDYAKRCET